MMQIVPVVEKQVAYLHVLAKLLFAGVFVVLILVASPILG